MTSSAKGKGKGRTLTEDDSDADFATQGFEPRESDSEQLWDVIAICGERTGMYLIQWAGADENGRPWDDSWVPREDVTDDLVEAWKKRKATEKKERARKAAERKERKRQGSSTTASRSRTNSKVSTTTSTSGTVKRSKRLSSVATEGRADTASVSTIRSSPAKKRKQPTVAEIGEDLSDVGHDSPRKKRKIGTDGGSRRSSPRKKSKPRLPDSRKEKESEDEQVESVRPSELKSQKTRREEEGESEDDQVTPIKHSKPGPRRADANAKPKPGTVLVPEEEEEEEEDDGEENIAKWSKATKVKPKPPSGSLASIAPRNGLPEPGRTMDKRPTPPRRTLTKSDSGRTDGRMSATPSSHDEYRKGTKHLELPGVGVGAEDKEGDVSNANCAKGGIPSDIPGVSSMPISDTDLTVSRSTEYVQETEAGVHSEEYLPDLSQVLTGTVIPQSQSQSQSQPHSESQDGAQDVAQVASVLAEHGSPVLHIDTNADAGVSMASVALASSLEVEIPPETPDTTITDPEPSAGTSTNSKAHKKIPVVTPSKFRPYLHQLQKPLSTLPRPHIQGIQTDGAHTKKDLPTSSFESPVKDFDAEERAIGRKSDRSSAGPGSNAGGNELSVDDDIGDDMLRSLELRHRGLELAEVQRRRTREEVREPVARIQLDALLKDVTRDSSSRLESRESDASNPSVTDLGPTRVPPELPREGNPDVKEEDDEARVRRFEEDYLDFDGNAGASTPTSGRHGSVLGDAPRSPLDEQQEEQPAIALEDNIHEEADVESSLRDAIDEDDPFISRVGVMDRADTSTTTTSHQEDYLPYTPARARFRILGSPNKLEASVVQTPSRQLNEAMGLLHAKSEEIEYLKHQLAESEGKRLSQDNVLAELQAENSVLKKTQEKGLDISTELEEGEIEQFREKYERLSKDRDALDAEIKLLKMSRDDSVKQAEIFRELYGKASSFAEETKRENVELLARANLAEGQVKIGLELIRKQNAAQEQSLRAELEQQRILVHVLSTKDSRTDDEVRRRAALEPELQSKIDKLQDELRDLEVGLTNVVRHRNELLVEKQGLSDQLEEMRANYDAMADDMCWLQIRVARLMAREKAFKKVFLTSSESIHDNEFDGGEERVYICKWMVNHDSKSRCNSLFTNVQDLKDHLFVDHQL